MELNKTQVKAWFASGVTVWVARAPDSGVLTWADKSTQCFDRHAVIKTWLKIYHLRYLEKITEISYLVKGNTMLLSLCGKKRKDRFARGRRQFALKIHPGDNFT